MNEFSTPITQDQKDFLAANKAELTKTDGGKAIWQNRVKMASEAYQVAKTIFADHSITTLVSESSLNDNNQDEDTGDEVTSTKMFPSWPTYRDNFILDWISNRTIVTEEEADAMFNREVDEALQTIGQADETEVIADATDSTPETTVATTPTTAVTEPTAKPKRTRVAKSVVTAKPKRTRVAKSVVKARPKSVKKVAAKRSGGSKSAKAQVLIEKYAARDWSRKDIIQKLQDQLDMGVAYASTLYQKFA